jgi:thioredoxin-like negative regulator of GroEL
VSKLGRNSFRSRVEKNVNGDVWLVQFYSHNCAHCRQFEAQMDELAGKLKSFARVGAINGEQNSELRSLYGISGYPTFFLFAPSLEKPLQYRGATTQKAISEWLANK